MENVYSLSDIAAASGNGMFGGNNEFIWIFALLILFGGGFGGWNNRGELGNYATAASQQEILFGQQFQNVLTAINKVGDGLASLGYSQLQQMDANTASINGNVTSEGRAIQTQLADCCCTTNRNIDSVRFDMANYASAIQANETANTQKILDALAQNKIEALQQKINSLELAQATGNVVRYPSGWTYNAGTSPFCACNNGCCM